MATKKSPELSFVEKIRRIRKAGIDSYKSINQENGNLDFIESLNERIRKVLGLFGTGRKKKGNMIYFIMYDIEHDKIRNYIAKYLIKKGCIRVQKSIFLTSSERKKFDEIHSTLREVQEMYDNEDSIFLVPVSTDQLQAMKVIGQNVDFDLITGNLKTLIF